MPSVTQSLTEQGLAHPPSFIINNVHYEVVSGSVAYAVADNNADFDVYGFCIPPKDDIFPHLRGEIPGFGRQHRRFEQYQEQHIRAKDREYDLSIYSIVKFFHLVMENNPNMVDTLFVPARCVLHITRVGQVVRDSRHIFLNKNYYHKARGFAFSQLSRIKRNPTGNRKELQDRFGYDTKSAYHVVRLMEQCQQVLSEGDLDLERSREFLKVVRAGEWTEDQVREYFTGKEKTLRKLYDETQAIPHSPDEGKIKQLLLYCLEEHYGSLAPVVTLPGVEKQALQDILEIASKALNKA